MPVLFRRGDIVAVPAFGRAYVCVGCDPEDGRRVLVQTLDGTACLSVYFEDLEATGYAMKG